MANWLVWGSGRDPIHEGTEAECKEFVINSRFRNDLYLQDPYGNEWIEEDGHWTYA